VRPATIAVGVASTKAQGQEMTSTVMTRLASRVKTPTMAASMSTTGVYHSA